jgi:hypothetical protein
MNRQPAKKNKKKRREPMDLNLMARSIVERAIGAPLINDETKRLSKKRGEPHE